MADSYTLYKQGAIAMNLEGSVFSHFSNIEDPRISNHNKRHELMDILVLSILAIICGADSWVAVAEFGEAKIEWLKTFLTLPNGIPSHDVIGDLFARLDAEQLQTSFLAWINSLVTISDGNIIAIDGKTLRRSYDKGTSRGAIHMVSAWSVQNSLVLGQVKTDEKSNEITAIPQLLEMLNITGGIITIDAMGCQKNIANKIIQKGADYVLALKGNQGGLFDDVQLYLDTAIENHFKGIAFAHHETIDKNHGRVEVRRYWVTEQIQWVTQKKDWSKLTSIGVVESERHINGDVSIERRYYINSIPANAKRFSEAVRRHWAIENALHWCLDVGFNEDQCRVREGYAAQNFSILRHIALNLLKQEKSAKVGIATKRLKAGWNTRYLTKILAGAQ